MTKQSKIDKVIYLYVNQKMKVRDIAKKYNCSNYTIRELLIENGVYVPVQKIKINLSPQQRQLLLDIFQICNNHFVRYVRLYDLDTNKLYDLLQTENAPYVIRDEFYSLFNEEDIADLWWERFTDWWFDNCESNNEND